MEPPHRIDLTLLGSPGLSIDGKPLLLRERRALCLLAWLGEVARPVARDEAAAILWPDSEPETGRTRLRRLIYKINSAAQATVIESNRLTLRFPQAAALDVDSARFAALIAGRQHAAALDLWRGPFLEGLDLYDSEPFTEWLFYRREALNGRYVHALERESERARREGDAQSVLTLARRLVDRDPLDEAAHRSVIAASLDLGDIRAARTQFDLLSQVLRNELGVAPSSETRSLLARLSAQPIAPPRTRYTPVDDVHIAWQTHGSGPVDVVVVPGFVSHLERMWEDARVRTWLDRAGGLGRLILFDRRGVGLSDRVGAAPTIEATAADIGAVMDAAGSRRAILFGASEGGPGCVRFAVDRPDRVAALILWGSLPKGSRSAEFPHALTSEQYDTWLGRLIAQWGGPAEIETFAPGLARDRAVAQWWASLLRAGSSPGAIRRVLFALRDVDVRHLLPRVAAPTLVLHRQGDRAVRHEAGQAIANAVPGAEFRLLDGDDHWFWAGDPGASLAAIAEAAAQASRP
ncbi:alpha/beta fold hydrolase [Halovulum dunhuangense]|uniref:Alpha/beta fold hydrolase n=1 Tax=Halovulum dunhuangense TaxID=1505036 RepID=A0A849L2I8_9RHOB|nr:alpha/beta fold hydrolase [Halovulum dunhuangense]NNU80442.1 alpha/beta fold hydrolase [Halovulum dunhuangense]